MISENAYAKINLFLKVKDKRADGFHDIESVMHSVSLCDVISAEFFESDSIDIELASNTFDIPLDSTNLVYRAAEAYLRKFKVNCKVKIKIEKQIPVAAGLGGGSSDAAATLRVLNKHFKRAEEKELYDLASTLGSDVAFCLFGKAALCLGRGEIIKPLGAAIESRFVVAIGKERVFTPEAFRKIDEKKLCECGSVSCKIECRFIVDAIKNGENFAPFVYNEFEDVTDIKEIALIKNIMKENGASASLMSGSGPSVFGIFSSFEDVEAACKALRLAGFEAYSAVSIN